MDILEDGDRKNSVVSFGNAPKCVGGCIGHGSVVERVEKTTDLGVLLDESELATP
jgi:hypothetical protein